MQETYIDLHMHSTHSDGLLAPRQLAERAKSLGISVIALCDHDAVSGIDEIMLSAGNMGIRAIAGVELSVALPGYDDVHLLAYCLDWKDPAFSAELERFRLRRERRNEEILDRINGMLASQGRKSVDPAEVVSPGEGAVGRPHIARALVARGYVSSMEEAFRHYLVPCNVPKAYWPIEDALREVLRIGGVPVLAHPTSISRDMDILSGLIGSLKEAGLRGVEVYNSMASPTESERLRRIARDSGLAVTAGSDFHGNDDGVEMGRGNGGIRFSCRELGIPEDILKN